jgi:hypothetical protein
VGLPAAGVFYQGSAVGIRCSSAGRLGDCLFIWLGWDNMVNNAAFVWEVHRGFRKVPQGGLGVLAS